MHIEKPKFGEPCNGCGFCCKNEVCALGLIAEETNTEPTCKQLVFVDGKYRCKLVLFENQSGREPMISNALGIGKGCCSDD